MIIRIALLFAFGIALYLRSLFIEDDGLFIKSTVASLGGVLVGMSIIIVVKSYEPTVIDYMRGKVDVNIQETYVDSILVKRDTIITYKK